MPPSYARPGIYLEEIPPGHRRIERVPTSIAGFVGHAPSGPVNQPLSVSSVAAFAQNFGSADAGSELHEAVRLFFANGGSDAVVVRVPSSTDPSSTDELVGSESERSGLFALDGVDLVNILAVPGQAAPELQAAMIDYAVRRRAFAILDLPAHVATPAGAVSWLAANQSLRNANVAVYFPRLTCGGGAHAARSCASSGAIAGVYARTDATQGVWKAPAGQHTAISGAAGLERQLSDADNSILNPLGINALRSFPSRAAPVLWGARTLAEVNEWKYVPVRRLALFLEESISRGVRWAVFEPNDERLWSRLWTIVSAFLQELFREGAFAGGTPREAYFVKCDGSTTTAADIDASEANLLVGFAPLKPAEFIVIRFQLTTAAAG